MSPSAFLRTTCTSRRRLSCRRKRAKRLRVEQLEGREVPAVTWDGGAGTLDWMDADNWSTNFVPGAADDVIIDIPDLTATIRISTGIATIKSLVSNENLTIDGGTLSVAETSSIGTTLSLISGALKGAGDVTVSGTFNWFGGTITESGTLVLAIGSNGTIGGLSPKYLGRAIDSSGSVIYSGETLYFGPSATETGTWLNRSGGSFNMQGGASIGAYFDTGNHAFINEGTFTKTGTAESTFSAGRFNNGGSVDVQQGVQNLSYGGNHAGTTTLASDSTLRVGLTHHFTGTVTGPGTLQVDNGTTTFGGTLTSEEVRITNGVLSLESGASATAARLSIFHSCNLTGAGNLTVTETFDWSGGWIDGTGILVLAAGSTGSISGEATNLGRAIDSSGAVIYSGEGLYFTEAGTWLNRPGGSFTMQGGASVAGVDNDDHPFINQGTFIKIGTAESSFSAGRFDNSGSVDVQQGVLNLSYGGNHSGTTTLSSGSTLRVGLTHHFTGTVTGPGTFQIDGAGTTTFGGTLNTEEIRIVNGILSLESGANATATRLSIFQSSTLTGASNLTVTGAFDWSGGWIAGTGTLVLAPGSNGSISSSATKYLGRTIDSSGAVIYSGEGLTFGPSETETGTWLNRPGASFTIQGGSSIGQGWGSGHAFNNFGTFVKTGAAESTVSAGWFNNSGSVDVQQGVLNLSYNGGNHSGTSTLSSGSTLRLGYDHNVTGTVTGPGTLQIDGVTTFGGTLTSYEVKVYGVLSLESGVNATVTRLSVQSGQLTGAGNLTVTAAFDWSAGTITGTGTLVLPAGSTASISGGNLGRVIDSSAAVIYSGEILYFTEAGTWLNRPGASFTMQGGASVAGVDNDDHPFINQGTFTKTGAAESSFSAGRFNNSGTVDVQQGVLNLSYGGNHSGTTTLSSGSTLRVGRTHHFTGTVTGPGTFQIDGAGTTTFGGTLNTEEIRIVNGILSLESGANATATRLSIFQSSTLTGASNLTVTGAFDWSGGWIAGTGTLVLAPGSNGSISSSATKYLGRTIDSSGAVIYSGEGLTFGPSETETGTWLNRPGASFTIQGGSSIGQGWGSGHAFNNFGTFVKTGATESSFAVRFDNAGSVDVQQGSFTLHAEGSLSFDAFNRLITSPGTTFTVRGPLSGSTTNADHFDSRGTVVLAGPGTAGSPQFFEVMGRDRGAVSFGPNDNFRYEAIQLTSTFVRLVDQFDNFPGAGAEVLYVDTLVVPADSTLDLNGFKVYARNPVITGTITGGTLVELPDGGPLPPNSPVTGRLGVTGEVDEWTYFGRVGQSLQFRLNPGDGANTPPPNPVLSLGGLEVLDPTGIVVSTADGIEAGRVVTVLLEDLAVDGIYKVRVKASSTQPMATGNYQIAAYETTVDTRPITFAESYTGILESDFSTDRWTFAANANQQAWFDLISTSVPGIMFTLSGPNGWEGFYVAGDSDPVTLPSDGQYFLEANGPKGAYAFRVNGVSVTSINLGEEHTGSLAGNGAAQLIQFNNPTANPLRLRFDSNHSQDRVEIYLRAGSLPTRSDYLVRSVAASASQTIEVPLATAGTWYALVYGTSVEAGNSYTLTATTSPVFLRTVFPDRFGTGQTVTLTLTGAGYVPGTQVELVAEAFIRPASNVSADSFDRLTAFFNLTGVPARDYDVRVRRPDNTTDTLVGRFHVVENGFARLETRLIMPSVIGRQAPSTIYVDCTNTGTIPMPAPTLVLQSADPDGKERPLLTLDASRVNSGFWTSANPMGYSTAVQFRANGQHAGLLLPGETVRVPVYYAGLQQPWDLSDPFVEMEVRVLPVSTGNELIDWDAQKQRMKPPTMAADAWDAIFENLKAQIGTTRNDYFRRLDELTAHLDRLGRRVTDISRLFDFQARLANGLPIFNSIAKSVDAAVPGPGMALAVTREFPNTIAERYRIGPLGRGWSFGWDQYTETLSDGTVIIHESADRQRRFQPDFRNPNNYFGATGDTAQLTKIMGGGHELKFQDGSLIRFRGDGKLDFVEDKNGNRISAGYSGNLLTILTHSAGEWISIAHNVAGRIASITESTGRVTNYAYDAANEHLLSATGPSGTTTYTYSAGAGRTREHALTSMTDPSGVTTSCEYDAYGRLAAMQLPGGAQRMTFTFDENGGTVVTNASGVSTAIMFEDRGLVGRIQDASGDFVNYSYNDDGQLVRQTDSAGRSSSFEYSTDGVIVRAIDAVGNSTTFAPGGPHDQPLSFTDANGNSTGYEYDGAGNLTATTYDDGMVERGAYDAAGLLTQLTNRRGQAIALTYNAQGLVTQKTYPNGSVVTYTYDAKNRLATAIDASGTAGFTYDSADRITRIDYPNSRWIAYQYDAAGRRTRLEDHSGFVQQYGYDAAGRLIALRDAADATLVTYTYDAAGRLAREDKGNGTFTLYGYDPLGRIDTITNHAPGGGVNSSFDYAYDAQGRRIGMTTLDGAWTYENDAIGQLVHAVFDSSNVNIPDQDLSYQYDALGNRTRTIVNGVTTDYAANNLNQYTAAGATAFEYDHDGNLVRETTPGATRRYFYDTLNRLIRVETPEGVTQYEYDVFGHRSATIFGVQRTEYLIDPFGLGEVVGEYNAAGVRQVSYSRGLGLEGMNGANGWGYYDFDAIGSTAGVSDTFGGYIDQYVYDPFGNSLLHTETVANPFEYIGIFGVTTEENGLQQMRARFYGPDLGRFISKDPIGIFGGDYNLHSYVHNRPVQSVDPEGLSENEMVPNSHILIRQPDGTHAVVPAFNLPQSRTSPNLEMEYRIQERRQSKDAIAAILLTGIQFPLAYSILSAASTPSLPLAGNKAKPWYGIFTAAAAYFFDNLPKIATGYSTISTSRDPNEKFGAAGHGPQSYISTREAIPYRINFENLGPGSVPAPNNPATAPAQRVEITDQLSPNLDWDTLEFTAFGFGDVVHTFDDSARHQSATVPMTYNGKSFDVETDLNFDPATGQLRVVFQAIDPSTFLRPDVLTGFLPPEDGTGRGKGHITYSIKPKSGLTTGTEIRNIALIRFDGQTIIATNQVDPQDPAAGTDPNKEALNTIDADLPIATINPLPAVTSKHSFPVYWDGYDPAGSGYADTDVFVSIDGAPYELWQGNNTGWSATYIGRPGHRYDFVAVGRDHVGNAQPFPPEPQASIVIPNAPTAVDDAFAVTPGRTFVGSVLGNDVNPSPKRKLTAELVAATTQGTLTLLPTGKFTYVPNPNSTGRDFFT